VVGRWFSLGTPVSSTNKTNRYDITEILLNVALNIITLTLTLKVILNHKGQYLVHHCYIRLTVKYHNPNPNPKSNIKPQGSISSPSLLYKTYNCCCSSITTFSICCRSFLASSSNFLNTFNRF